ncbi:hypothetical protein TNCV_3620891 [Trichonephila clavipes]|nr:hypothetical protein TNCV_3620891 [Trichonephila clavipes]
MISESSRLTSPDEIWILCDSRSAIKCWRQNIVFLKNLKELSHEIYFGFSHIGLFGNDADLLATFNVEKNFDFLGNFSKTKSLIHFPTHPCIIGRHQVVPFPSRRIESSKQLLVGLQVDTLEAFPLT